MSHTFGPKSARVGLYQVLGLAQVVYLSNEGDLKFLTHHRYGQMYRLRIMCEGLSPSRVVPHR
jgi:hypothetical protein